MSSARSTISMARSTPAQKDRGPASTTRRRPAAAAHRASAGPASRSDRSAAMPPASVAGPSGRCGVSEMARSTTAGRSAAAASSGTDSRSAASAPAAASRARPAPRASLPTVATWPARRAQPGPPQLTGQQRCRRAVDDRLAVADLGAHHQVAGRQVTGEAAAGAGNRQHPKRDAPEYGRLRRCFPGPVAGPPDVAAGADAAPDGARLQPQRRADEQPVHRVPPLGRAGGPAVSVLAAPPAPAR